MAREQRKKVFEAHEVSAVEHQARAAARRMLCKMGYLMPKGVGDPREVHHVNGNSTVNSLDNLVALNECWHDAFHGGKCKSTAC